LHDLRSTSKCGLHYNRGVAQRIQPAAGAIVFGDLERAVDQLFEDLLISHWRTVDSRQSPVVDRGAHYEIRITAVGADPSRMEVEVTERRVIVRIPGIARPVDYSFELAHAVDAAGVTARWLRDVLEIILPKKPGRKVKVE
jgi:HSP20 family molecular chaperone IbpA